MFKRLFKRIKKGNWKRQTGALFLALYVSSKLFGIELPEEAEKYLPIVGEVLFGIGWADKLRRIARGND